MALDVRDQEDDIWIWDFARETLTRTLELDQQLETAAVESEKAEMLVCCYLSAVGKRRAYRDFGYTSITDYAQARFGFGARKTGYLVSLGRKIEHLPKIRAALASGKLGWCKASRLASVAGS